MGIICVKIKHPCRKIKLPQTEGAALYVQESGNISYLNLRKHIERMIQEGSGMKYSLSGKICLEKYRMGVYNNIRDRHKKMSAGNDNIKKMNGREGV